MKKNKRKIKSDKPEKRDFFERAESARKYFQSFIDRTKNLDPKDFKFS